MALQDEVIISNDYTTSEVRSPSENEASLGRTRDRPVVGLRWPNAGWLALQKASGTNLARHWCLRNLASGIVTAGDPP